MDTPEDINEVGLSDEARKLWAENEQIRGDYENLTQEFLTERDARNTILDEYDGLVKEYNATINKYNTGVKQDVYLYNVEINNTNSERNAVVSKGRALQRNIDLQEINIETLKALLEQIKGDFDASDKHFVDYINKLKATGLNAQE